MVIFVADVFPGSCNVLVYFCSGEHWQFGQRITPSICWIINCTRGTLQLRCIRILARCFTSKSLLFSLCVQPTWIRIHNIFIFSCLNVLFNSKKENTYQEYERRSTKHAKGKLCNKVSSNINFLTSSQALLWFLSLFLGRLCTVTKTSALRFSIRSVSVHKAKLLVYHFQSKQLHLSKLLA